MDDLKLAVEALVKKKAHYDRLWGYYDGNQPLVYSTERLKHAFSGLNARFSLNWCAVVVDSVLERMEITQLVVRGSEQQTRRLNNWWEESGMNLDSDEVELCALVTGEAFVIAWPDESGTIEAYYNDSRMVHVEYDPDRPRQMRMAAKWYVDGEKRIRLTLYYPDRLEYYISTKEAEKVTSEIRPELFRPMGEVLEGEPSEAENPLERIPVFHFRRERRAIASELSPSVLDVQDAINKLLADMMVASEFGAFKQRYIISQADDLGALKNAPNEIWDLPAGDGMGQDTSVGQFSETQLQNFLHPIQELSTGIAKMTRTPQYYFFLGARSDPSGETLYAMDGPLVAKTSSYIKRLRREWELLARFVAEQIDLEVDPLDIRVEYGDPRQSQPFTQAQTRVQNKAAGIPLRTQLRREGWSPRELAELDQDVAAEQESQQATLARALLASERDFNAE